MKNVLTDSDVKKIDGMTKDLYELAQGIRSGHVELNRAREFNVTARNIQNQYKIKLAAEILAHNVQRTPSRELTDVESN